ncbi:MAG: hypothetical protein PHF86_08885 [Candidatus Nanoarchaeia archaeon]|nr:hypothetical protein [Candidatus Nanoarchaeia archaeon]
MKKFVNWYNKRLKRLDIWDMALIKTAVGMFALVIGAYFSKDILQYWYVFIIIMILAMIKPYYKALK